MFGDQVLVKRWKDGVGDVANNDQGIDGRNKKKGDGKKESATTLR